MVGRRSRDLIGNFEEPSRSPNQRCLAIRVREGKATDGNVDVGKEPRVFRNIRTSRFHGLGTPIFRMMDHLFGWCPDWGPACLKESRPELSVSAAIMKSELMSPRLALNRNRARRLAEKKLEPNLVVHGLALLVDAQDFLGLGTGPSGLWYDQWTVEWRFAMVPQ
jgi:hypothetical protein